MTQCGDLTKPFSIEEVKHGVWDCDNFKSSKPDAINFEFIKDFLGYFKADFMRFIIELHWNGKSSKVINSIFIALIPKVESPQCLSDSGQFFLVESLYKVMAKMLSNRLRNIIGSVISESQ